MHFLKTLGSNILILGDGNLTFSLSLSRIFPDKYIIATVYEEESEWRKKYADYNADVLDKIKDECKNTKVVFKVDALDFEKVSKNTKFTDIIFNFPHYGGKTNLRKCRLLLRKIFESVARTLRASEPRSSRFHVTFAPGQSGIEATDLIYTDVPPKHNKDSWQPLELASEFGMVATSVERFDSYKFPEYSSSGYKNTQRGFKNGKNSQTITFEWSGYFIDVERLSLERVKFIESSFVPSRTIDHPIFHQFRPVFQYHISIVFGSSHNWQDIEKTEGHLFSLMSQCAGPLLVSVCELADRRCTAPGDLHNRIYCVKYQGIALPLCRNLGNALHDEFCSHLNRYFEEGNYDLRVS